ncbi:MAG: hypothetical protein BGP10_15625 [Rhodanobacter sp. 68-29]|nr:hypothetical protein [Rhodanobacter sp.]ODV27831.1 MAG: hypothetical protein ABT19_01190 [Rhodanobacter sp. SCN 68-63]OJY61341.1 MAG: hypothetical protein BGP10_15625 [Rhodanobacter sp. 68-29]
MKRNAIAIAILASALLLPLTACSQSDQDTTQSGVSGDLAKAAKEVNEKTSSSMIGAEVRKSIEQAKKELVTQDVSVGSVHFGKDDKDSHHDDSRPKAVITPQGDLVIDGKPVTATPEQHAMLLDYRQQIIGIASAGMDIGASGADIGVAAARQAILGAFTGKSDKEIEASIKPQTDQIEAAAMRLCKRMPDLLASQQKLAAAMPAFQPYATMTQKDVDNCGKDTDQNGKKGFAVFSD